MRITQDEVAKKAGVSRTIVSLVVNKTGHTRVSEEKRRRVLDAIEELGYRPDAAARSLVSRKTRCVGLAIYDMEHVHTFYFMHLLAGMGHTVGVSDYNLHFTLTNQKRGRSEWNINLFKKASDNTIDGAVIVDQVISDRKVRQLSREGFPLVLVDRVVPDSRCGSVLADHYGGCRLAMEHLVQRGRRRIAFLSESFEFYHNREKLRAYRDFVKEKKLPGDHGWVTTEVLDSTNPNRTYEQALGILQGRRKPDAFMVTTDDLVLKVYKAVREKGYRIPEDISVVGFNDLDLASSLDPPLTTVKVPLYEMGEAAAELLMDMIESPQRSPRTINFHTELVTRRSA